jgi:hypothetical protein
MTRPPGVVPMTVASIVAANVIEPFVGTVNEVLLSARYLM